MSFKYNLTQIQTRMLTATDIACTLATFIHIEIAGAYICMYVYPDSECREAQ